MTREQRQTNYLARAKDADEQAAKTKDPVAREYWRTIAEGYRTLARTT